VRCEALDAGEARVVLLKEPACTRFAAWAKQVGWHDEIAETLALGYLRRLDEAGCYDRDVVRQYAELQGSLDGIARLEKLLDRFQQRRAA
jgi:hypothetical protein